MLKYIISMKMSPLDRTLTAVPASNSIGLVANIMRAWSGQCTLIVMPEFEVRTFLELTACEKMTHTVIVPAMYKLCLLEPDFVSFEVSIWRAGGYGGAPIAERTIVGLARKPGLGLHNIYGSTDTCGPVIMLPCELAAERPDSTGFAMPCAEIIVIDQHGCRVPRGDFGELWIRGPMVVAGYWVNTKVTRQGLVASFWRSGYIGSMDAQGFVRVWDRLKDMLNHLQRGSRARAARVPRCSGKRHVGQALSGARRADACLRQDQARQLSAFRRVAKLLC